MMEEASRRPRFQPLPSHHATFRSPKIAIGVSVRIPSSDGETYRGCKALSNLKEGELSMSSMAFAIGYNHSIGIMVDEVVKKLHTTASLAKEFFCLSDGSETMMEMASFCIFKILTEFEILFGCPIMHKLDTIGIECKISRNSVTIHCSAPKQFLDCISTNRCSTIPVRQTASDAISAIKFSSIRRSQYKPEMSYPFRIMPPILPTRNVLTALAIGSDLEMVLNASATIAKFFEVAIVCFNSETKCMMGFSKPKPWKRCKESQKRHPFKRCFHPPDLELFSAHFLIYPSDSSIHKLPICMRWKNGFSWSRMTHVGH